ncbi:MAG TPA: glycosyltransferase family 39 protein [Myxococcota bacterium]|nr:glycosyltransferase family 39 protein [Myxococcota bacterium]
MTSGAGAPLGTGDRGGKKAEALRVLAVLLLSSWPAVVGMVSPHDLEANDQGRAAMYVLAAVNGDWLVPNDRGETASKPPLQAWLAALGAKRLGLDEYTVRLPSVFATVLLGLVAYAIGRRLLNPQAALIGVALFATLWPTAKLSFFVRFDMLVSLWIALALYAYALGRPRAFWICVGLGTLTKGPAGLAPPIAAVAVDLASRRDLEGLRALRPLLGIGIVTGLVALWMVPAYLFHPDQISEMVQFHLIDQLTNSGTHATAGYRPFWFLVAFYFLRFLPWSLLLPEAFRRHGRPSDPAFLLVAWIVGGLFVYLFPPSKRPDHVFAMYVPGALLAGSVLAGWLKGNARPILVRLLDGGARLWAFAASAFALVALPLAWMQLVTLPLAWTHILRTCGLQTFSRPPLWAFAVLLVAAVPLWHVFQRNATPRARLVAALGAQALACLAYAQVLAPPAVAARGPAARRFAAEVADHAGGADRVVLCEVRSWEVPFLLHRNDRWVDVDELERRSAASTPSWVVLPHGLYARLAAQPGAFAGRGAPPVVAQSVDFRPLEDGDLVLVEVGGAAAGSGAPPAREGAGEGEPTPAPPAEPPTERPSPPEPSTDPSGVSV